MSFACASSIASGPPFSARSKPLGIRLQLKSSAVRLSILTSQHNNSSEVLTTMMQAVCPNTETCGRTNYGVHEFCDYCGTRLPPASEGGMPGPGPVPGGALRATKLVRVGAFAIDILIVVVINIAIGAVGIPTIGPIVSFLYLLFRDVNGGSVGKMALGCRVVDKRGRPAKMQQLILRNITLVLGEIAGFLPIPFLGPLVGAIGSGGVSLIELVCLLATGERIGDMLAATMVVKR